CWVWAGGGEQQPSRKGQPRRVDERGDEHDQIRVRHEGVHERAESVHHTNAVQQCDYLASAFFFQSSHGRGIVPPTEASAFRASSSSRYVTGPPSAMACACSFALTSV